MQYITVVMPFTSLGEMDMNYTDENRGTIQNEEYAKRIINFGGLRYGNITPTDIDGVIEYHDTHIVFFEFKYGEAPLPYGQRVALERIVNNCANAGKQAILCVCRHNTPQGQQIDAANTPVSDVYVGGSNGFTGQWIDEQFGRTLKEICDAFLGINWRNS